MRSNLAAARGYDQVAEPRRHVMRMAPAEHKQFFRGSPSVGTDRPRSACVWQAALAITELVARSKEPPPMGTAEAAAIE